MRFNRLESSVRIDLAAWVQHDLEAVRAARSL
jgi:hypothetical protein